jgi:hypothetical protein
MLGFRVKFLALARQLCQKEVAKKGGKRDHGTNANSVPVSPRAACDNTHQQLT